MVKLRMQYTSFSKNEQFQYLHIDQYNPMQFSVLLKVTEVCELAVYEAWW